MLSSNILRTRLMDGMIFSVPEGTVNALAAFLVVMILVSIAVTVMLILAAKQHDGFRNLWRKQGPNHTRQSAGNANSDAFSLLPTETAEGEQDLMPTENANEAEPGQERGKPEDCVVSYGKLKESVSRSDCM